MPVPSHWDPRPPPQSCRVSGSSPARIPCVRCCLRPDFGTRVPRTCARTLSGHLLSPCAPAPRPCCLPSLLHPPADSASFQAHAHFSPSGSFTVCVLFLPLCFCSTDFTVSVRSLTSMYFKSSENHPRLWLIRSTRALVGLTGDFSWQNLVALAARSRACARGQFRVLFFCPCLRVSLPVLCPVVLRWVPVVSTGWSAHFGCAARTGGRWALRLPSRAPHGRCPALSLWPVWLQPRQPLAGTTSGLEGHHFPRACPHLPALSSQRWQGWPCTERPTAQHELQVQPGAEIRPLPHRRPRLSCLPPVTQDIHW